MLRLTRDSAIYALGAVAGKAVGVVLLPVLTRALSTDDYGRLEVLSTLGSALISALLLGIDRAALRLSFSEEGEVRRSLLSTWYGIATALVLPPALVCLLFAAPISAVLFGNADYARAVAYVGGITVFGTYQFVALTILRAERRPGAYAALSGATLVVNAALVIAFVALAGGGLDLVLAAFLTSVALGAVVGIVVVRGAALGRPSAAAAHALLVMGLPLAPAVVVTWAAEFANRAIVLAAAGPTEVAYLGIGLRAASIAGLAVVGLQLAWEPHAYALGTASLDRLAHDARRALVGVSALVVAVALVAREAVEIVAGPGYVPALPALGFCLIATLAAALFVVTTTSSALAMAMRDIGIATVAGIVVGVVATLALARPYGGAGAAAGIALGQLCAAVLALWLGRARSALPIAWLPTAAVLVAASVAALAATVLDASVALRAALAASFAVVLLAEGSVRALTERMLARARA